MTIAPLATSPLPRTGTSPNARAQRQDERGHPWLTLVVVAMLIWLLWPAAYGGRFGLVIVDGNSMQPTYEPGDIVVTWRKPVEIGTPVFMRVPEGQPFAGIPVIHRVIDRDTRGWVTQGDNSPAPDAWRLQDEDVLGEAVRRLPGAGTMIRRALDPRILGLLVGAVIVSMMWPEKEQRPVRTPGVLHIPAARSGRRHRGHPGCELFDPDCACRRHGETHLPSSAEEELLFGVVAASVPSSAEDDLLFGVAAASVPSSAEDDLLFGVVAASVPSSAEDDLASPTGDAVPSGSPPEGDDAHHVCDLFDPRCACPDDAAPAAATTLPPLPRRRRDGAYGPRYLPLGSLPMQGSPSPRPSRPERPTRVG